MRENILKQILQSHCPQSSAWEEINGEPSKIGDLDSQTLFSIIKANHGFWFCLKETCGYSEETEILLLMQFELFVTDKKPEFNSQDEDSVFGEKYLTAQWRCVNPSDTRIDCQIGKIETHFSLLICLLYKKLGFLARLHFELCLMDNKIHL